MFDVEGRVSKKSSIPVQWLEASGKITGKTKPVSMLFDTGCNIDCISYDIAKKMNLKINKEKKFRIRDAQDNDLEIMGDSKIYVA